MARARRRVRLSLPLVSLVAVLVALAVASAPVHAAPERTEASPWYHVDESGAVRIDLYVFWSTGCPHCRRAVRFIEGALVDDLPWLDVHLRELSEPGSAAMYGRFAERLGVEAAYVPAFFYCGGAFHGYGEDDTTGRFLRDSLTRCHAATVAALEAEAQPAEPPEGGKAAAAEPKPTIDVPFVGTLDPASWSLPAVTVALAGMDAFNPCAFFVLLFLLSLMVHARSRARMALVGGVFVLFSGSLYFVFMAAWLNLFLLIGYLPEVTAAAGLIALAIGALNVKDFVWFRKGPSLSIPEQAKPGLYQRMRGLIGASSLPAMLIGTVALAMAANTYELLCTAGFPLVFTRILTLNELGAGAYYGYLALYNLVYVLPLLAIVVVFVATLGARKLKEEEGRTLKLLSGLMMLGLGAVLLLAPDWLNQPLVALGLVLGALLVTALLVRVRRMTGTPDARSAARP